MAVTTPVEQDAASGRRPLGGPQSSAASREPAASHESISAFVGREHELAELSDLSARHRLICLVGPGGMGKTRLAAELARRLELEQGLPATFVVLEPLRSPQLVASAIAAQLGVRDGSHAAPTEPLVAVLAGSPRVLVLDAAEHVRDSVAQVAAALLDGAPALRVIVTSRRPLGDSRSLPWAVPPLRCPEPGASARECLQSDAARLFAIRARERLPRFDLAAVDPAIVGELCRRLGGLPLAIELIAGWTGTLSVEEILSHRASLLAGQRGADGLTGILEASYEMLDDPDRVLLQQLSTFAGSFTMQDAHAVTEVAVPLLVHSVRALVDASWLHVEGDGHQHRFILLDAIREFAAQRRAGLAAQAQAQERHARHYASLAVGSEAGLTTPDAARWRTRISAAWPDIEQALAWTLAQDEAELGRGAAAALWRWWLTSGRLAEGRSWLARFLATAQDRTGPSGARALASAAVLANENGDYRSAADQGAAALRIFEARGDQEPAAFAATAVGSAYRYLSDIPTARRHFERAMNLRRALADRRGVSVSLNNLALLALDEGDLVLARDLLEESLLIKRQLGEPRAVALGLLNLSEVLLRARSYGRAERAVEEAVEIASSLGDRQLIGTLRCNEGQLADLRGDWESAAAHYAEAAQEHRIAGHQHDVVVALVGLGRALHRLGRGEAVKQLRDAEALAVGIGNAAHLASVRAALAEIGEASRIPPPPGITAREAEVLGLLGTGLTNREIAARLYVSVPTVERHLATVYRKLGLRGRVEAARYAVANGLASVPR
jgi:predicted ATPase/DNA-binding CsgD family transcriptional regulator